MHTLLDSLSWHTKEDIMSTNQPSSQCSHKDYPHSSPMHAWISTTWTVSMNGQWQPRGTTRYTSKSKPSKACMDKANPPPFKEHPIRKWPLEGDQDVHRLNRHKLTQTPWIPAQ